MVPEINIWAVLLATVSSMVVGSIWYTRAVFGRYWMKAVGHTEESMKGGGTGAIIVTVIVSFITASVLAGAAAIAQNFYGGNFLANTLLTGIILWAGFTAARMVTHDAFDRRPAGLTVLNLAHELVTILFMALIIGLFGISAA
jgi:fatty acid desaturase